MALPVTGTSGNALMLTASLRAQGPRPLLTDAAGEPSSRSVLPLAPAAVVFVNFALAHVPSSKWSAVQRLGSTHVKPGTIVCSLPPQSQSSNVVPVVGLTITLAHLSHFAGASIMAMYSLYHVKISD